MFPRRTLAFASSRHSSVISILLCRMASSVNSICFSSCSLLRLQKVPAAFRISFLFLLMSVFSSLITCCRSASLTFPSLFWLVNFALFVLTNSLRFFTRVSFCSMRTACWFASPAILITSSSRMEKRVLGTSCLLLCIRSAPFIPCGAFCIRLTRSCGCTRISTGCCFFSFIFTVGGIGIASFANNPTIISSYVWFSMSLL